MDHSTATEYLLSGEVGDLATANTNSIYDPNRLSSSVCQ